MLAGSYKVCCQLSLMFIFLVLISPVFITLMLVCLAIPTQPSLAVSEKRQVPETWNLKVAINKIIGRGEEKAQIEKILNQEGRVALVGAPGVGKTCLALHYARLKYQDYNIVWVINLANDLKSQLLELLVALDNLPRNALSNPFQGDACKTDLHTQLRDVSSNQLMFLVREKLRKTNKTWLLVLDDVRSRQTLYDLLPETHGDRTKHVLITSNNTKICESVIPLGVFTESEALAFLQLKLTRTYKKSCVAGSSQVS
ncbi:MAG: ATP-binding protein [Pseudomonadota bacterium]